MRNIYYGNYDYMMRVEEQRHQRIIRTQQVRRQKLMIIIGIFITILICTILSIKALVYANDVKNIQANKQYKSICIYCGDSVDSIAEEYYTDNFKSLNTLKDEIRSINHISSFDSLIPGNYIVIPYYINN